MCNIILVKKMKKRISQLFLSVVLISFIGCPIALLSIELSELFADTHKLHCLESVNSESESNSLDLINNNESICQSENIDFRNESYLNLEVQFNTYSNVILHEKRSKCSPQKPSQNIHSPPDFYVLNYPANAPPILRILV